MSNVNKFIRTFGGDSSTDCFLRRSFFLVEPVSSLEVLEEYLSDKNNSFIFFLTAGSFLRYFCRITTYKFNGLDNKFQNYLLAFSLVDLVSVLALEDARPRALGVAVVVGEAPPTKPDWKLRHRQLQRKRQLVPVSWKEVCCSPGWWSSENNLTFKFHFDFACRKL